MAAKDQGEFREIAAELLYTPLRMRYAHLARLERLIPELLPDRMYTYEYIFHRITLFNPDSNGMAVFPGRALICGLCGVLRDLTRQAPLEAAGTDGADDEAVLSLRAAAAERGVSPGTVWRWGAAGLPIGLWRAAGPQPDLGRAARGAQEIPRVANVRARPGRAGASPRSSGARSWPRRTNWPDRTSPVPRSSAGWRKPSDCPPRASAACCARNALRPPTPTAA